MALDRVKVKNYTIVRKRVEGSYIFEIWRDLDGKSYKTENDKNYFSDAAKYVALQNGLSGNYAIGYVEALIQVYEEN